MKKVFIISVLLTCCFTTVKSQDLVSGGRNSWIFHTPDDGRTDLFIAPKTNGSWDWGNGFTFKNNGLASFKKMLIWNDLKINRRLDVEGLIQSKSDVYAGDFISRGKTDWIIHTSSANNSVGAIHFAPMVNGNWQWGKQVYFTPNADLIADGKVGIGSRNPDSKLTVKGKIHCEEVKVDLQVPADYVFEKYYTGNSTLKSDYKMPTLEEVEAFTKKNNHLPEMPSAKEIKENGLHLKKMTNLLLQKIEELTLYTIEQEKRIKALEKKLADKE